MSDLSLIVLLDYDGTLTPIVSDPAEAVLRDSVRGILQDLTKVSDAKPHRLGTSNPKKGMTYHLRRVLSHSILSLELFQAEVLQKFGILSK